MDEVLEFVEEVTSRGTEYFWIMTDRPVRIEHSHPHPESMSVRCVLPKTFGHDVVPLLQRNWPGARVELAYLEPIPATVVLNERKAVVLLPGLDGRIDLSRGLAGESPAFHGWCRDLFNGCAARAGKALL